MTAESMAPKDVMAFSATVEPMLIKEINAEITREKMMAGRGIFQRGETLLSQLCPGKPRSRAND